MKVLDTRYIDVFIAVPTEADYALVPKENSIFGIVNETFDLLREEHVGTSQYILEEIDFQMRHCLLARSGVELSDINRVVSHEQVQRSTSCTRPLLILTTGVNKSGARPMQ